MMSLLFALLTVVRELVCGLLVANIILSFLLTWRKSREARKLRKMFNSQTNPDFIAVWQMYKVGEKMGIRELQGLKAPWVPILTMGIIQLLLVWLIWPL
jgi:hypothetical protein